MELKRSEASISGVAESCPDELPTEARERKERPPILECGCVYEFCTGAREKTEASNLGLGVCLVYMSSIQKLWRESRGLQNLGRKPRPPFVVGHFWAQLWHEQ